MKRLQDGEFRALLDLYMWNDPWPLESGQKEIHDLLVREAKERGYESWTQAYHEHEV